MENDEIGAAELDPLAFGVLSDPHPPPQLIKLTPAKTAIEVRIYLQ